MNFYFEKIDRNTYFVSNDSGESLLVNKRQFENLIRGKKDKKLAGKCFWAREYLTKPENIKNFIKSYSEINRYVYSFPSLHIIVMTLKCNHFCIYCRATDAKFDKEINEKTLIKTIDFILDTPNPNITIEFQGGEPLLNWNLLKKGIEYIRNKNKIIGKNIIVSLVTNLSLMDNKKLKFLIKNKISICTSLDGPKQIHDKNRIYHPASSYDKVVYWYKMIKKMIDLTNDGNIDFMPSALMTTTRYSLNHHKEIIDEYLNLGLGGIFLRPLSPIGYAKNIWEEIGYSSDDFLSFYEKSLNYIIEINKKGTKFVERNAAIKLRKILLKEDPNFLDLRNPCGAVIGQLAYNYDGDIYTCDEGRMVGARNDKIFKVGNVFKSKYKDVINSSPAKLCLLSSCLENQPLCVNCAFKPYCGVCPVFNYETSKTPFGSNKSFYWCQIEKGIFKIILKMLKNGKNLDLFMRWFDA